MTKEPEQKPTASFYAEQTYSPVEKETTAEAPAQKPTATFLSQQTYTPVKKAPGRRPDAAVEMPFIFPLGMLVVCLLLAFVDLAFLTDVVGQVLNVDQKMALVVSFGLGLVGLAFMAHLGYMEANQKAHRISAANRLVHYSLWILLGIAIAAARFFTAVILGIQASDEEALVTLFGTEVRQVDMIFAPIMFLLYVITGLGAKESMHSLLLNPSFHGSRAEAKVEREQKKKQKVVAEQAQLRKIAETKQEMEAKKRKALAEAEEIQKSKHEAKKKKLEVDQPISQANAIGQAKRKESRKEYYEAVKRYKQLESTFHERYKNISGLLAKLEAIDGEATTLGRARDNMFAAIDKSEDSLQQQVAFVIHVRTQEPIAEMKAVIASHNLQQRP